jgi:hypothetical protein
MAEAARQTLSRLLCTLHRAANARLRHGLVFIETRATQLVLAAAQVAGVANVK